jgi:hypothetical protein
MQNNNHIYHVYGIVSAFGPIYICLRFYLSIKSKHFLILKKYIMSLTSRTSLLVFLAQLRPQISDALIPHGPKISVAGLHVMAAMIIKSISQEVKDAEMSKKLYRAGKTLFDAGTKSISYEDDVWYFGPQPEPWHQLFGKEEVMLNPQPLPPHEPAYYGALLILLSNTVFFENIPEVLHTIGETLMKTSSEKLYQKDHSKDHSEMPLFSNA